MNEQCRKFEERTKLGPTFVAKLIGTAYSNYSPMRAGRKPLPPYISRCMEAMMLLSEEALNQLIGKYVMKAKDREADF